MSLDEWARNTDKRLEELLSPGSTLMVGTTIDQVLDFRPLTVAKVSGSEIDILIDGNERWVREFVEGSDCNVTMSDDRENTWLTFRGTATMSTDPQLIDELWNPAAGAYFDDGRESPGIAVMRLEASEGRYWSTPSGRLGSLLSIVKAKVAGAEASGDSGDLIT